MPHERFGKAILKIDIILRTPEGRCIIAVELFKSRLVTFAQVPAALAYCIPLLGHSSTFDIFRNWRTSKIIVK